MYIRSISCGLPLCDRSPKEQTSSSGAIRIAAVFAGVLALLIGVLVLAGVPGLNQLGTTGGWGLTTVGSLILLCGLFLTKKPQEPLTDVYEKLSQLQKNAMQLKQKAIQAEQEKKQAEQAATKAEQALQNEMEYRLKLSTETRAWLESLKPSRSLSLSDDEAIDPT